MITNAKLNGYMLGYQAGSLGLAKAAEAKKKPSRKVDESQEEGFGKGQPQAGGATNKGGQPITEKTDAGKGQPATGGAAPKAAKGETPVKSDEGKGQPAAGGTTLPAAKGETPVVSGEGTGQPVAGGATPKGGGPATSTDFGKGQPQAGGATRKGGQPISIPAAGSLAEKLLPYLPAVAGGGAIGGVGGYKIGQRYGKPVTGAVAGSLTGMTVAPLAQALIERMTRR